MASWLVERGIAGHPAQNAVLIVHELVSRGVLDGGTEIAVRAQVEGDALFVEVTTAFASAGVGPPPVDRGVVSVRLLGALCDVVDIRDERSGARHVICTISLQ
jgi:hypothetical protein